MILSHLLVVEHLYMWRGVDGLFICTTFSFVFLSFLCIGSASLQAVSSWIPGGGQDGNGQLTSANKARRMGRKAGIMRINPKTLNKRVRPCLTEMLTYLACLKRVNFNDDLCRLEKDTLNHCMDLQAKKGKERNTLNFHLQRIERMMKGGH